MKRFLSWVVLAILTFIGQEVFFLMWFLATKLYFVLTGLSKAVFWILVICEGGVALTIIFYAFILIPVGISAASQAICPSKKGTRYLTAGIVCIVIYALLLLGIIIGIATSSFPYIATFISMIIHGVVFIIRRLTLLEKKNDSSAHSN